MMKVNGKRVCFSEWECFKSLVQTQNNVDIPKETKKKLKQKYYNCENRECQNTKYLELDFQEKVLCVEHCRERERNTDIENIVLCV